MVLVRKDKPVGMTKRTARNSSLKGRWKSIKNASSLRKKYQFCTGKVQVSRKK
jgi:hypothetical protein